MNEHQKYDNPLSLLKAKNKGIEVIVHPRLGVIGVVKGKIPKIKKK